MIILLVYLFSFHCISKSWFINFPVYVYGGCIFKNKHGWRFCVYNHGWEFLQIYLKGGLWPEIYIEILFKKKSHPHTHTYTHTPEDTDFVGRPFSTQPEISKLFSRAFFTSLIAFLIFSDRTVFVKSCSYGLVGFWFHWLTLYPEYSISKATTPLWFAL